MQFTASERFPMKRILAIDWDPREIRFVIAAPKGRTARIRAAAAVPLPEVADQGDLHSHLGQTLRQALAGQGTGGAKTLVAVDRASVELLDLTLPPAKDFELPVLVANEVIRESPASTDQSVIDFVPLGDDPSQPREVSVAILPVAELNRIRDVCKTAGLKPQRIVLRSHFPVSLFLRTASVPEAVVLLVNPVGDEVELTVVNRARPQLLRTTHLPGRFGEEKANERLLAEIRRTLALAMQGELGDDPIQAIYIAGRELTHRKLLDRIRDDLTLPVKGFDPFDAVDARDIRIPDHPEAFAPLLGMALDEIHGGGQAVDFLHPRQGPKPIDLRRMIAAVAAVLVAAAFVVGYFAWDTIAAVRAENKGLVARAKELDALAAQAKKQEQLIGAIQKWQAGDVLWLEELRELSERFPPRRDAVIHQMSMVAAPSGGTISFRGMVRDSSIVIRMESNLRDQYHQVYSRRVHEGMQAKDFAHRFETVERVVKRDKNQYASLPTESIATQDMVPPSRPVGYGNPKRKRGD